MDHDQKFKQMIQDRFSDLIALFLPHLFDKFDFDQVEWLNKELFTSPPDGEKIQLDLLAKIKSKQPADETHQSLEPELWYALVFIEIESPTTSLSIKRRMLLYYFLVWFYYGYPVLPIVLFLNLHKNGIHKDYIELNFFEEVVLRLEYTGIGLKGLDAVEYRNKGIPLGYALSILMKQSEPPFEAAKRAAQRVWQNFRAGGWEGVTMKETALNH